MSVIKGRQAGRQTGRQAGRIVAATIQKDGRVPVIILSLTRPCFADYGALTTNPTRNIRNQHA
jgi:hypothetical protein